VGASYDRAKAAKHGRIEGRFTALPHAVLNCAQYRKLGYTARSLLFDLTLQWNSKNNGALVLCQKAMRPLGWSSNDTLSRATLELEANGLIIKTRQGRKPSVASWFALSWVTLDIATGLDIDPKTYRRMTYDVYDPKAVGIKSVRKPPVKKGIVKDLDKKVRPPPIGIEKPKTAPSIGIESTPPIPSIGAVEGKKPLSSIPSIGEYLDKPYLCVELPSHGLYDKQSKRLNATARMYEVHLKLRPKKWVNTWCSLSRPIVIQPINEAKDTSDLLDTLTPTTRDREDLKPAPYWDEVRGEHRDPPTALSKNKTAIAQSLNDGLDRIEKLKIAHKAQHL
jgi:hypothetical protein